MAKKHPLEVVLEHYINEDVDQAQKLFHQYIIQTARQKYEELMAEDDTILEDVDLSNLDDFDAGAEADAIKDEESYGEGLSEAEDDDDDSEEPVDVDMEEDSEEDSEESESSDEEVEERVADLEEELAELKAEFEKLMSEESEEDSEEDSEEEFEEVEMADHSEEKEDGKESEEVKEDEDMDLDDMFEEVDLAEFEDLGESAMQDYLHKVRVDTSEDNAGAGGQTPKLKVNAQSPLPQRKLGDRMDHAGAFEIKSSNHMGFDLEKAPAVNDLGKFSNTHKKAMAPLTKVPAEGDKTAKLNSDEGFGKENNLSPISGKARVKGV